MNDLHRGVLKDNRTYLLQNIYLKGEMFWGHLVEKKVLTDEMMDEIKSCPGRDEKISKLLENLQTCGPEAYNMFIEALVKGEQSFIAEKLKQDEACAQYGHVLDKCVERDYLKKTCMKSFKESTSKMMMFGKQMYGVIGEDQAKALETAEEERNKAMQKAEQQRSCLHQYKDMTAAIASELSQSYVSDVAVAELQKQLDTYKSKINGPNVDTYIPNFVDDMQTILTHLRNNLKGFGSHNREVDTQTEETVE